MSKIFEMLQQAQRDQELLKQSAPQSAIHSRNMDVLHRAGKDQTLFELPSAPDVVPPELPPLPAGVSRGETYKLVQHLFLTPNPMSPRAVVFCGVGEESGRDWICAQSAELLAHFRPSSICVVDANVNNPTLHTYFGLSNARGLSAALAESGPVTNFTQQIGKGRLRLLNAGDRSAELGAGASGSAARLAARVRELRSLFDYVLVNAPPAMHETVTGYLGSLSDGIVLIVEPGFTPREATRASKEEIEASGGRVLGVVLHRRALSLSDRNNSQLPAASDGPAR